MVVRRLVFSFISISSLHSWLYEHNQTMSFAKICFIVYIDLWSSMQSLCLNMSHIWHSLVSCVNGRLWKESIRKRLWWYDNMCFKYIYWFCWYQDTFYPVMWAPYCFSVECFTFGSVKCDWIFNDIHGKWRFLKANHLHFHSYSKT